MDLVVIIAEPVCKKFINKGSVIDVLGLSVGRLGFEVGLSVVFGGGENRARVL